MRRFLWAIVCAIVMSFGIPLPKTAHSQDVISGLLGAGVVALGGLTVDSIMGDISNKISEAQSAAESSGNRLIANGADQAYNMLLQMKSVFAEQRQLTFQQLSNERQLAIYDLYVLAGNLQKGIADDFARAAVQSHILLSQIRFIGKDVEFLIVRVAPPIFIKSDLSSGVALRIFGVGLGTDQGRKTFSPSIAVDGRQIPSGRISRKEWGIEVVFEPDDFAGEWPAHSFSRVPITVSSDVTVKESKIYCWWYGCRSSFSAVYHLDLYPTEPAIIQVHQETQREILVGDEELVSLGFDVPYLDHPDFAAPTTGPVWSAGNGWKWTRWDPAKDSCSNLGGNGCPFVAVDSKSCVFSQGNTAVQCTTQSTGASANYRFGLYKKRIGSEKVALPSVEVSLLPGEKKRVEVSLEAERVWVDGTDPLGASIGPINLEPPTGNALSSVVCLFAGNLGDRRAFDCELRKPW